MKRIALLTLLGMAALASARSLGPEPVTVRMGGAKPHVDAGLRIGDECYVKPGFFALVGWACSIFDGGVEINTGESKVKEAFLSGTAERLVPLRAVLNALGMKSVWRDDRQTLQAIGTIHSLEVSENSVRLECSLPILPAVSKNSKDSLLIIDVEGATVGPGAVLNVKWEQVSESCVRIHVPTRLLPADLPAEPALKWEVTLTELGIDLAEAVPLEPVAVKPPPEKVPRKAEVGGPVAVSETSSLSTYEFPILGQLASPPTISRVDPSQIQVVFPGATYTGSSNGGALADIRSIEAREDAKGLTLNCSLPRPMGAVLSATGNKVTLSLYKPEVGDGKIAGKVIVVDPGHGGSDTGARSNDGMVNEKDINLAIALKVAEKLSKQGATVIMTRRTDVKVPLKERAEIANRNKAHFFISIHINSNQLANSRSGSIAFYHGGNVISSVLAECVQKQLGANTGLPSIGVWSDTKIYSSGFAVLRYAKMPAVLLELGFINHTKDLQRIVQPDFHNKVAESVVRGLGTYLGNGEGQEKPR